MMMILALLCGLVGLGCTIFILIHAFAKGGIVQGLLSLFIPFYIFYYAFAKFDHEKRGMVLAMWFGAMVLQVAFMVMGVGLMAVTG